MTVAPKATVGAERVLLLLAATTAALTARVAIAGIDGVQSVPAGLVFAAALALIAVPLRPRIDLTASALGYGLLGAAVIIAPAAIARTMRAGIHLPAAAFPTWALVVTAVAIAEEFVFRGVLFTALEHWRGTSTATVVTTVGFALIHAPLYGWASLPLDLAVGAVLAALRIKTGSAVAPAAAHIIADLAGWFLR